MSVFELRTLANGLRVLTADVDQAQSVTCMIMLAAGSRYETRDTNGIAHFAEHMFFKGTERRPTARSISAEIDGIGGEFNAFTSKEFTGYYVKCAAGTRDVALDVLVDMLRNSRFDAEEIEREKGVIVDLKTTRDASPDGFAKSVAQYRYHVQAAFYSDGYKAAFGEAPRGFVFIAVETEPPYLVAVYVASETMTSRGRIEYQTDLDTFRECLATDTWPGYSSSPLTLDLPKWA